MRQVKGPEFPEGAAVFSSTERIEEVPNAVEGPDPAAGWLKSLN